MLWITQLVNVFLKSLPSTSFLPLSINDRAISFTLYVKVFDINHKNNINKSLIFNFTTT